MIVGFGTYDTGQHPRVGIVLDGLRGHGFDVVELNRPLDLSTADRVEMLNRPWLLPKLGLRLARRWFALARDARRLRNDGRNIEAVVVGYLGHFDVLLARALFRRDVIVLDHMLFAAETATDRGADGLRVRALGVLDRMALSRCDIAVVDTTEHRDMLAPTDHGVVVPVGARQEWYDAAERICPPPAGPLRVVFFGLFTPLQGAPVIAEAVRLAKAEGAAMHVTMIGTGQDHAVCREILAQAADVTWTDWVTPHDLPAVVAAHHVCLGIFADSPKSLRVVPNKAYEGLAAGCAVVTSDTAPQRRALADFVTLVPPADPRALADALLTLDRDPQALAAARERARAGARQFTAERIVEPLVAALRATPVEAPR